MTGFLLHTNSLFELGFRTILIGLLHEQCEEQQAAQCAANNTGQLREHRLSSANCTDIQNRPAAPAHLLKVHAGSDACQMVRQ